MTTNVGCVLILPHPWGRPLAMGRLGVISIFWTYTYIEIVSVRDAISQNERSQETFMAGNTVQLPQHTAPPIAGTRRSCLHP